MTQCDETFQKIQALQQRKRQLERMGGILANAGGDVPDDPAKKVAFRDKETGATLRRVMTWRKALPERPVDVPRRLAQRVSLRTLRS